MFGWLRRGRRGGAGEAREVGAGSGREEPGRGHQEAPLSPAPASPGEGEHSGPDRQILRAWIREAFELQYGPVAPPVSREERARRLQRAAELHERVLAVEPGNVDSLFLLAMIRLEQGRAEEALALATRATERDPETAPFHHARASALRALGREVEALPAWARAAELAPEDPDYAADYGAALASAGRAGEAMRVLEGALALAPGHHAAGANLARLLGEQGAHERALAVVDQIMARGNPGRREEAELRNLAGFSLRALGRAREAREAFERAVALDPLHPEARNNLGVQLQADGEHARAEAAYREVLASHPAHFLAAANLGLVLQEQGKVEEARATYERLLGGGPPRTAAATGVAVRLATLLPVIAQSEEEIERYRTHLRERVEALGHAGERLTDPVAEVGTGAFHLAYHALPNRELHEAIAAMYRRLAPGLAWEAAHVGRSPGRGGGRLRVGLISRFFHDHSIGRTSAGLFDALPRRALEVHALFIPPLVEDAWSRFIRERADRWHVLPPDLAAAREAIARLELDVLFYQDIGMEPMSYCLAHARLAPVQCVSFGHPDTTGIPTLDYFVTSDLYETPEAASHYSEAPFLLEGLGTLAYYYRPELPPRARTRSELGLPEDATLYGCLQTLFKLHPRYDAVLGEILRRDPRGLVLLVEPRVAHWRTLLETRLRASIPEVAERVRFVPPLSRADFLGLLATCDVALDTPWFNGQNTSLEALSVGTPIVTWPGPLQRGRHTWGMYQRIGDPELSEKLVAPTLEQYAERAVAVGTDRALRAELARRLQAGAGVLFEDERVVLEMERFFLETAQGRA